MTLLQEFGRELELNIFPSIWLKGNTVLEQETLSEGRWDKRVRYVVQRGDEIVAVEVDEPLTEYQDVDYLNGEVYPVSPEWVSVLKYVRTD